MMHYEIKRHIPAPVDRVWPILTDAARLADGSFGILRLEGEIRQGTKIKLWSEVDPKRAFAIKVAKVTPQEMIWESGLPLGLFSGRRRFVLTPVPGGTEFHMREDYTGPLAGLMFKMIPDLGPSFETFANGLEEVAR